MTLKLLAAGSYFALALAAPASAGRNVDTYRTYVGTAQDSSWPSVDRWFPSFEIMFQGNVKLLGESCSQFNVPNNSDQEIDDIYNAVNQVSGETGVDARFIFAVMMQESGGCARAPTTNYGVRNPGLMQSHNGVGTCNDKGAMQIPCPASSILQMVRDGAAGTPSGDGLVQLLQQSHGPDAARYYQAARKYNSGSIDPSGDLGAGIATHCYSSDVANRLTGWVRSRKTCHLDGAGDSSNAPLELPQAEYPIPFEYSERGPPSVNKPAPISFPQTVPPPAPAAPQVAPPAPKPAVAPPTLQRVPQGQRATSNKMAPGVTTECAEYYRVVAGDFCIRVADNFGITFAQLRTLNTQLDAACSNLWKDYDYCVKPL